MCVEVTHIFLNWWFRERIIAGWSQSGSAERLSRGRLPLPVSCCIRTRTTKWKLIKGDIKLRSLTKETLQKNGWYCDISSCPGSNTLNCNYDVKANSNLCPTHQLCLSHSRCPGSQGGPSGLWEVPECRWCPIQSIIKTPLCRISSVLTKYSPCQEGDWRVRPDWPQ